MEFRILLSIFLFVLTAPLFAAVELMLRILAGANAVTVITRTFYFRQSECRLASASCPTNSNNSTRRLPMKNGQ